MHIRLYLENIDFKKITSDAGTNFVSEKSWDFCRHLNIYQAVSSSYNHQSSGQVETCIKFMKHTIKECFHTNDDIYIALLPIHLTPIGPVLQSPAMFY